MNTNRFAARATGVALAFALSGASASYAGDDTQPKAANGDSTMTQAEADKAAAKAHRKKTRCKYTKVVNSRIPVKVCLTNEEWDLRERETLEEKRGMINRNSYCSDSGPC